MPIRVILVAKVSLKKEDTNDRNQNHTTRQHAGK